MRILTLCYEYPPVGGGGGVMAAALARQLTRMGHEVEVVTSRFGDQPRREEQGAVVIHRHDCRRRHQHYTTATELLSTLRPAYRTAAAIVRDNPPHLLHAHFALPTGLVAEQLSRKFGIPYVLTIHGSDIPGYNPDRFRWHHKIIHPLWKRVMVGASEIVSPSKFLASLVRRQINIPMQIVPNGYSREAPGSGLSKRPLVLVVSRLFPRKGVQHFLEAIRELNCDWEFVIAGDGPYMPELRALAATVRPNVRFTGFIDQTALHQLYEQARILVFPSIKENFPMVLLEGMSAGCAVITTNADGCSEVVSDTGLVVPAESPASLKAALLALINDPARCDDLSRRARVRAEQFRWPHIASLYLEVFHGAMRWRPGGAPAGSI